MSDNIYQIKIVPIENIPIRDRNKVIAEAQKRGENFAKRFKGFVKVTYITNSPMSIKSIEPIEGTIIDYYNSITKSGKIVVPEF